MFKEYFHNHYEGLYNYAFSIVKNRDEAKDIIQSVFIKLWEKRNEINIEKSGKYYLYKAVYNRCLNSIRHEKIKQAHVDAHRHLIYNNAYLPEEKEINTRISIAINSLSPKCREVFIKSRFEGKKYLEIAKELNISVKTVEAQMSKALKILRDLLSDLI